MIGLKILKVPNFFPEPLPNPFPHLFPSFLAAAAHQCVDCVRQAKATHDKREDANKHLSPNTATLYLSSSSSSVCSPVCLLCVTVP
jgi:hypothetical protein